MAEITLAAKVESIAPVTDFVTEQLDEMGCPMKVQMQLAMVVDELFGNIARYAYPSGEGRATVHVEKTADGRQVEITFIDQGVPYNPLEREDPDITLSAEEREIGGLGIFMVKKSVDDMRYRYENGQNLLTVAKQMLP